MEFYRLLQGFSGCHRVFLGALMGPLSDLIGSLWGVIGLFIGLETAVPGHVEGSLGLHRALWGC